MVGTPSLYGLSRCIFVLHTQSNNHGNNEDMIRLKQVVTFIFGLMVGQAGIFISLKFNYFFSYFNRISLPSFHCLALLPVANAFSQISVNRHSLAIRSLTGAWCLTCCVLVTAYSRVLVSFLTAPSI